MRRYLIYAGAGHISGRKLAQYMGIPYGKDLDDDERYDYVVRYGSRKGIRYIPDKRTINRKTALEGAKRRYDVLTKLDNAGIPVPPFARDHTELRFPVVGRQEGGMGGDGVTIHNEHNPPTGGSDFYMEFIPKDREFRVHVMDGTAIKVSEKKATAPDAERRVIWNLDNGFTFRRPDDRPGYLSLAIAAVDVLDLDFGAVDMVAFDGNPYILELNTAPGIMGSTVEIYARNLGPMIELETDDMPGWDNVDDELTEVER